MLIMLEHRKTAAAGRVVPVRFPPPWRTPEGEPSIMAQENHRSRRIETSNFLMIVLILIVVASAAWSRSCRCSSRSPPPAGRASSPTRAAAGGARHLHPRGLLQLPLADDPPLPRRDLRYGHYSVAGEFVYDHPFQWGSKRTGPDLHAWAGVQRRMAPRHLNNPRDVVPESNMPAYPWLERNAADAGTIQAHMRGLRKVGVPYTDEEIAKAPEDVKGKTEMDAVIAYLQVLGTAQVRRTFAWISMCCAASSPW
jgi:cytochrome c oxidase cbb3-type subunit 2